MSAHYFVSDAHLGAAPAGAEKKLVAFLRSIRGQADSLYILGDLFDFWFEYGRAIPKHGFRVLAGLARLRETGTRIVYIAGNHDIRFTDFFRRELDIETAPALVETIDGLRVFMRHGDEVDRRPVSLLFRRLMKSRLNNFLYSFVHPDIGIGFAAWVARRSRARGHDESLRTAMHEYARHRLADGHDVVMLGHVHYPELRKFPEGVYLNTGDWLDSFSYGVIRDGTVALEFYRP